MSLSSLHARMMAARGGDAPPSAGFPVDPPEAPPGYPLDREPSMDIPIDLPEEEDGVSNGDHNREHEYGRPVRKALVANGDLRGKVTYLPDTHRLLPQSPDAEQGVICSVMLNPGYALGICRKKGVTPAQFHIPANAEIFAVMEDMYWEGGFGAEDRPLDFIAITNELRNRGQLDQVGGAANITDLFTFVPTAANVGYYIEILQEKWTLRQVITTCTEYATRAYDEQDNLPSLLEEVQTRVEAIVASVGRGGRGLPEIEDCTDAVNLFGQAVPAELIMGVLHKGGKMVIGGGSKSFKTFVLMDLALSVATGHSWWGLPTTKGRVLYINLELQKFAFGQRHNKISEQKGVTLAKGQLEVWNLRGHSADLSAMAGKIIERARRGGYALIVLDPIYKCLGDRDENAAGDIGTLLNEVERLSVQTGAAVAFGHHYAKGNASEKEAIDRVSGSGVWTRDPDAILMMTRHEEEGAFTVDTILRNFPPMKPFVVKWQYPLMVRDGELDPEDLKRVKKGGERGSREENVESILQYLGRGPLRFSVWQKKAREEDLVAPKTFEKYVGILKKQGRIIMTPNGWMIKGDAERRGG